MKSNKLQEIDEPQKGLLLPSAKPLIDVDIHAVRAQPTINKAIDLCARYSGFECDKEIYMPLGIDAGHWTRISNGSAHFPINRLEDFMDLCRNEIPMIWLTDRRGYEMVKKKSRWELENEELQQRLAEKEIENRVLRQALTGPRT